MQEEDNRTTYDRKIRHPMHDKETPDHYTRRKMRKDHTIPRRRENYDHMRRRGEQLGRHKRPPIGTSKERNIKLRSLEPDTFLPHAKISFILFKSSTPTTMNENASSQQRDKHNYDDRDPPCRHELDGMFRRRVLGAPQR